MAGKELSPSGKVLVVEDSPESLQMLGKLFAHHGYQVQAARTATAAIRMLDWSPDFVLLDLMLPDGNGIVVLQRIREMNLSASVAIITGMQSGSFDVVLPLRPDRIFQKPVDFNALLEWLQVPQGPVS